MKRLFLTILCWILFANLTEATMQIQNDESLKTTKCNRLKNYDENETNEFLYYRR